MSAEQCLHVASLYLVVFTGPASSNPSAIPGVVLFLLFCILGQGLL